jgi:hypothetical protein
MAPTCWRAEWAQSRGMVTERAGSYPLLPFSAKD